jgi:hypothetical protein
VWYNLRHMNLNRKENSPIEEGVYARFFELQKGLKGRERDRVLASAGIYRQDGKYFWLFDATTGRALDEMCDSGIIPWRLVFLAGEGSDVANCLGDNQVAGLSSLTKAACKDLRGFISMAERWNWEGAADLRVVELSNPPTFPESL